MSREEPMICTNYHRNGAQGRGPSDDDLQHRGDRH